MAAVAELEVVGASIEVGEMVAAGLNAPVPAPTPETIAVSGHQSVQTVFISDATATSVSIHSFFAQVLPSIAMAFAVFAVFAIITWAWTAVWAFLLRQCRVPEHWVRLTTYVWGISLIIIGLAAALGAIGVNVGHAVLALGLLSVAFSYGLGDLISNVVAGIRLQTNGLFASHKCVKINDLKGKIIAMNLLYVSIAPFCEDEKSSANRADMVIVPNNMLTSSLVEVWWEEGRGPSYDPKPSRTRFTNADYGRMKRQADSDEFRGRFSGHDAPSAVVVEAGQAGGSLNMAELARRKLGEQRNGRRSASRILPGRAEDIPEQPHLRSNWSFDE